MADIQVRWVAVAAAIAVLAIALYSAWIAKSDTVAVDIASADIESTVEGSLDSQIVPSTTRTIDPDHPERHEDADDAAGLFGRVSPADIESAILQRIAEQSGLKLTSLNAVDCDARTCQVVFSGVDVNPQYVDAYSDLLGVLTDPHWNDFMPTSGSIGTREVSPGVREYVIGLTYVALVDASADPETAARQQAACAGAWARVTGQRGSDDYIRGAHEQAAEWLEMSARVLGFELAQRLADDLPFGPLTRDCHAMPY